MGDHGDPDRRIAPRSTMSATRPDPLQWRELLLRAIVLPAGVDAVPRDRAPGRRGPAGGRRPEPTPAVPLAAMDRFAVRRADLTAPGRTTLPVSDELPARPGQVPALAPGTAARIMTGAPVPLGADAVVEVEASDADPFGPVPSAVTFDLAELPPAQRHVRGLGEAVACA